MPVIVEQNKNSQNAKKLQALGFFRMPNVLGRNEKKSNFISFPSRLEFSKLQETLWSILEKKCHEYLRAEDLLNSQIFKRKWKKINLYKLPEIYKQNTDSETNEHFSAILRNVFQELLKCPILNLKEILKRFNCMP